jgi:hypothetical protein
MSTSPVVVVATTDHHLTQPKVHVMRHVSAAAMVVAATFKRTGGLAQQVAAGVEREVHQL